MGIFQCFKPISAGIEARTLQKRVLTQTLKPSSFAAFMARSGRAMARTGLRMMPTFPSSPLKFRTAGFPQYGFKAGFQKAPSREWRPRVTPSRFASFLRARRLQHCILRTVSETLCAQPPPCERLHRSTPGVLTPVRVILSRSIDA